MMLRGSIWEPLNNSRSIQVLMTLLQARRKILKDLLTGEMMVASRDKAIHTTEITMAKNTILQVGKETPKQKRRLESSLNNFSANSKNITKT